MSGKTSSSSSRRWRRRHDDYAKKRSCRPWRKRHLYLALDDWNDGYSIHKLDADDILDQEPAPARGEHKLPEPAAVRIALQVPGGGPMAFSALGTNIFIDTNPRTRGDHAPPTFVYDTKTSSLTVAPRVPDLIHDLSDAMAVGEERLYALTSHPFDGPSSLQALSWAPTPTIILDRERYPWEADMAWSWNTVPSPEPAPYAGTEVFAYALHPDGHTIFVSSGFTTHSLDTSTGVWKDLGDCVLPFRGQAYFDSELDAWVGLHRDQYGHVCCCPVTSRSSNAATAQPPGCKMLVDKLTHRKEDDPKHWPLLMGKDTSLVYMGDSRYVLLENIPRGKYCVTDGAVLHVTLFGLKYDHNGELRTKVRRATRSYAVSKNTCMFAHAAFWL